MLIIVIGSVGSGKTLLASIIAKYTHSRRILANYWLNLPNYEDLQPEQLMDLPENEKFLVIMDEAYVWLESLTTSTKIEQYLSDVLFQSRKRNIDIIITSQLVRRININFREMEDYRVECYHDTLAKQFSYNIKWIDRFMPFEATFSLSEDEAQKAGYYDLYKTKQLILTPSMRIMALEFIMKDPIKLAKYVNEVSEKIKPNLNKINKVEIANQLLQMGYPAKLKDFVYNKLKSEN